MTFTRQIWMRLKTIDNMVVTFDQHYKLTRLDRPKENVATVATAYNIIITPKGGLFDLAQAKDLGNLKSTNYSKHLPQYVNCDVP